MCVREGEVSEHGMQHVAGDMHMPRTVVAVVVERNSSSCSVHRACSGHNWQVLSIWPGAVWPGGRELSTDQGSQLHLAGNEKYKTKSLKLCTTNKFKAA